MTKISQDKIVRAAVGSARLEGYKGTLKVAASKKPAKAASARADAKPRATAKR